VPQIVSLGNFKAADGVRCYVRTPLQITAILCVCLFSTWLLNRYTYTSPPVISGIVIDWRTQGPAAFARVLVAGPNTPNQETRTDAHGRFQLEAPGAPEAMFLYPEQPRYGRLLQTTFGATVFVYRKGEQVHDVVIPAFPTTEVSGRVHGDDGKAVAGCFVSAVTRAAASQFGMDLQGSGWRKVMPDDLAEAADPMHLEDVDWAQTDSEGRYALRRLGADRYYVLTRCDVNPWTAAAQKRVWQPMFYPDAATISQAKEVVLLPGDHCAGIDFHLRQRTAYGLKGSIRSNDGSAWKSTAFYSQDLVAVRSDEALGSTWLGKEACQIYANDGAFRCSALLPDTYTFYFRVENGITQTATFRYTVSGPTVIPVEVQLRRPPNDGIETYAAYAGPAGTLDVQRVCEQNLDEQRSINVLVWGPGRAVGPCSWMLFRSSFLHGKPNLSLPPGDYTVNAVQATFKPDHSYLGSSAKFESILMQHGTHVHIETRRTTEPNLPVLRTSELIDVALRYLRTGQHPHN
jgi:hypothetical protein